MYFSLNYDAVALQVPIAILKKSPESVSYHNTKQFETAGKCGGDAEESSNTTKGTCKKRTGNRNRAQMLPGSLSSNGIIIAHK